MIRFVVSVSLQLRINADSSPPRCSNENKLFLGALLVVLWLPEIQKAD